MPSTSPQTTVTNGFVSVEDEGGTTISSPGNGNFPARMIHRGTLRPLIGQSCPVGPGWKYSGIDGGPHPEDSPSRTTPT